MQISEADYGDTPIRGTVNNGRMWFVVRDIIAAAGYNNAWITNYHADLPSICKGYLQIQRETKPLAVVSLTGALLLIQSLTNLTNGQKGDLQAFLMYKLAPLLQPLESHAYYAAEITDSLSWRLRSNA